MREASECARDGTVNAAQYIVTTLPYRNRRALSTHLKGHAGVWKARIWRDHQLHAAFRCGIATKLPQSAEQVLKRRGLLALGDKPLCATVKAALGRVALQPRHRELCGGMAL